MHNYSLLLIVFSMALLPKVFLRLDASESHTSSAILVKVIFMLLLTSIILPLFG